MNHSQTSFVPGRRPTEGWRRAVPVRGMLGAVLMVLGVAGCGSPPASSTEAAARVVDAGVGLGRRLDALQRWRPDPADPGGALRLAGALWSDRTPRELRLAVLEALDAHAPETLWNAAPRALAGVGDPEVVAAVARRAADGGHRALVGALVRRWARRPGDPAFGPAPAARPEARAVTRLTGLGETEALRGVLQDDPSDAHAAAAWTLLQDVDRRFDAGIWAAAARSKPPASVAARVLAQWAPRLDGLPVNGEQVRGLTRWRGVAPPPSERPRGVALRHLPLLAAGSGAEEGASVAALVTRLAGSTHVPRRSDGALDPSPGFVAERLTQADVLALHATLDALATPRVVAALFTQADADRTDRRSEHGGGLLRADAGWSAVGFASARRVGDHAYVSPPKLIAALYRRGLAHYHFHAQRHHHADYAGPGPGDLAFAAHTGLLCLTLTFINPDHLNVDAALPDGTVIDLGCIGRPGR